MMTWLSLHTAPLLQGSSQTAHELVGTRYRRVPFGMMCFDPRATGFLINVDEIIVPCGFIREPIVCAAVGPLEDGPGVIHNRFSFGASPIPAGGDVVARFKIGGFKIDLRDETYEGPDAKTKALEAIAFSNLPDLPDSIRAIARIGLGLEAAP